MLNLIKNILIVIVIIAVVMWTFWDSIGHSYQPYQTINTEYRI